MKCPFCKEGTLDIIYKSYPGYVEGSRFDIYLCPVCDTHTAVGNASAQEVYDIIYKAHNFPGYERYYHYAHEIKNVKNPLQYLSDKESSYYPVYQDIEENQKNKLDILEVGCGYGYLTYALREKGHSVQGIDGSQQSINFALSHFGPYFEQCDLSVWLPQCRKSFDRIVATELIEHLPDPGAFILNCIKLLKPNGKLILTTPNKDFASRQAVWKTELPPVHYFWFSRKSFSIFGTEHNLHMKFIQFKSYYPKYENILGSAILKKLIREPQGAILLKDGSPNIKPNAVGLRKILRFLLVRISPIRNFSNWIYNCCSRYSWVLAVAISPGHDNGHNKEIN